MIDPLAVLHLEASTTVETPDGPAENVSRIAVWDWSTKTIDGDEVVKAHTNSGDVFLPAEAVEEIDEFVDRSGESQ
jgi:hypothetical protein